MMRTGLIGLGLAAVLSTASVAARDKPDWRADATVTDQVRIDEWRDALVGAVKSAQREGFNDVIVADPELFTFGWDQTQRPIPDGLYSCASTQMDKLFTRGLALAAYPAFRCRVETLGGVKSFRKLTGSQRTVGRLYPASDTVGEVFLGTEQLGDDQAVVPYGTDTLKNDPAVLQSMEDGRWRMIFPGGLAFGTLEILDLRPVDE